MASEITVQELKDSIDQGKSLFLLDVREDLEVGTVPFEGAFHISLGQLSQRLLDIPKDQTVVTICHHGVRSLRAACFLEDQGYKVFSLKGGIDAWARQIDPSIPLY